MRNDNINMILYGLAVMLLCIGGMMSTVSIIKLRQEIVTLQENNEKLVKDNKQIKEQLYIYNLAISDYHSETDAEIKLLQKDVEELEIVKEVNEPNLLEKDTEESTKEEINIIEETTIQETTTQAITEEITTEQPTTEETTQEPTTEYQSTGGHLTAAAGVYEGVSGKETYYNLDMSGVVATMRSLGYSEEEYPYWVREDGCKMLGAYIMVAANLEVRPRGTILECSLGTAIVCDTGGFASSNPTQLDIATTW